MNLNKTDTDDDYEFARQKYYDLLEKGDQALDLMIELARDSEHPRAFEVLSNMLKQNAEIADRLLDNQKKKKDIEKIGNQQALPNSMTQNNVFVGSTTDLQKMLAKKFEEKDHVIDPEE
jgi:Mg2+ and Co2+ transporter CorA